MLRNNMKIMLWIVLFYLKSTVSGAQVTQNMLQECLENHLRYTKIITKDTVIYNTGSKLYADFYYGIHQSYPQYQDNGFKVEGITIKKLDDRKRTPLVRRNEVIYLLDMYLTFEKDKLLLYMITKSLVRAKKNRYNLYNSYGEVISIFNVEYNPDLKRFEAKLLSQGNQDAGL